jgi:hypothetical protein
VTCATAVMRRLIGDPAAEYLSIEALFTRQCYGVLTQHGSKLAVKGGVQWIGRKLN